MNMTFFRTACIACWSSCEGLGSICGTLPHELSFSNIFAPEALEFFCPKLHSPIGSMPLHRAQKISRFPGPNPLPLALVMDMHASKTLCTGLYKS